MKKNLYIILALLLVASFTIAAGGNNVKIQGVITAIDDDAQTITVNGIVIHTKPGTQYYEKSDTGCVSITFKDLAIGDRVNVIGQYVDGVYVANKIIVH